MTQLHPAAASITPDPKRSFGGFVGPRTLMGLVANTAPYLLRGTPPSRSRSLPEIAAHPLGWRAVLTAHERVVATPEPNGAELTDYFTLCVAAHFATVATFIPTDVDSKIRDRIWNAQQDPDELRCMAAVALQTGGWDVSIVTHRRLYDPQFGWISGHDGERLSILAGGLLALLRAGQRETAERVEAAIDAELQREADFFNAVAYTPGREVELLCLAAILTHNVGDVDQGLAARWGKPHGTVPKLRFGKLAHERVQRYDGAFARAAEVYRHVMSSEGHRHYPLRELKVLRGDPALLLPISPFLDGWGAHLASYKPWTPVERADVVGTLIWACSKLRNQVGYFRALAGFDRRYPRGIQAPDLTEHYPASVRKMLKDASLRRMLQVRQESFESGLGKRGRAVLASWS